MIRQRPSGRRLQDASARSSTPSSSRSPSATSAGSRCWSARSRSRSRSTSRKLLKRRGVKHNVLNAVNHEAEANIIAQAGRCGTVTIATNMAGRGTDILLGGNPEFLARAEMENEWVRRTSNLPEGRLRYEDVLAQPARAASTARSRARAQTHEPKWAPLAEGAGEGARGSDRGAPRRISRPTSGSRARRTSAAPCEAGEERRRRPTWRARPRPSATARRCRRSTGSPVPHFGEEGQQRFQHALEEWCRTLRESASNGASGRCRAARNGLRPRPPGLRARHAARARGSRPSLASADGQGDVRRGTGGVQRGRARRTPRRARPTRRRSRRRATRLRDGAAQVHQGHRRRRASRWSGAGRAARQATATCCRSTASCARSSASRWSTRAASSSSAPSGTRAGASTTSCAAAPAARAIPARRASSCRSKTTCCASSAPSASRA